MSNFIDRAIEWISPELAIRREVARSALASHRGGISTRTSRPWSQSNSMRMSSTDARKNAGHRRDRARAVYNEHPVGRGLLMTETDNIIADGFRLQSKTGDRNFDREAEEGWETWLDRADIRGMRCGSELQRQWWRAPRRDGDGGIILVDRGGESRLQFVPGDLICNPDGKISENMADGVEVDATSRPVAFHCLDQDEFGNREWTRIPASNFVYLAPVIDDDLGVRGDSCYSQIFGYLDGLDGYIDAVIIAARMAAVFGLVFKEGSGAKQLSGLATVANSEGKQQKAVTLENGMVKYIGTEDSVVQVQAQQPMTQTPDFIRAISRLLGIPFDMPLELAMKDMSQVNFASARIGLLGYYRACRAKQRWFRVTCMSRIYQWWISRERKRQQIGMPGAFVTAFPEKYWTHKFIAQGWDYTDPVSEAQADQLQIDMGIKTPQMVSAERGRDWEEMQEDLAVARMERRLKQLGNVKSNMTRDEIEIVTPEPAAPAATPPAGPTEEEVAIDFKRKAWLGFQSATAAVAANLTDMKTLTKDVGLPVNAEYSEPWMPVVASTGPLVSGEIIYGPDGAIVGGDVENAEPAADPIPPAGPDPTDAPEDPASPEDQQPEPANHAENEMPQ